MNVDQTLTRCQTHPATGRLALPLIAAATSFETEADFLESALGRIRSDLNAAGVALARGSRGRWRLVARSGKIGELPEDLMSDVLDEDSAQQHGVWTVAPLDPSQPPMDVLVVAAGTGGQIELAQVDATAAMLALVNALRRDLDQKSGRIRRLTAILEIAASWNQTREMVELLNNMAEASTHLLNAERASIFLWDKTNGILVGRPALGVDDGELRIPDDTGIVGQVVRTGEVRRVDHDVKSEQSQINRDVDKHLGFTTRSLLCVPLRGSDGELFGAFEMINKRDGDFTDDDETALLELAAHASVALENTQWTEQLVNSRREMADEAARGIELIGECPAIIALGSTIERVARTDLSVLIHGENGTGKEVVARMVHYLSDRRNEPLVAVNCAAISETLLESELFGHEKGAFTDAHERRAGKFELAGDGTLFLDEIGDMSLGGQAKLLRVLEEKIVVRVGGSVPTATNARVFAATNQDLAQLVREKRFREDLYYRLNVVTLELPPLRERGNDVILLAEHFLSGFARQARRKMPRLTAAAKKRLLAHSWQGNVRELRNLMERLAYLSQEDKIDTDDIAFILTPDPRGLATIGAEATLADATKQFQVRLIRQRIDQLNGNMTQAAEQLGLHRSNLYRKMRQLGMDDDGLEG